jgi:PAS domain S-box-containing protein
VSPEVFRSFADSLPEGMLLVSGDGTILAANRRLSERLRRSSEALVGTPLATLTLDGTGVSRLLEEWSRSARLSPATLTMRAGDEVVRFLAEGAVIERAPAPAQRQLLVRLMPKQHVSESAPDLDRQVRALGDEIARRRRVEHALRHREAELREIADAMPQMVLTAREDGSLDFYNRQWRDYTGLALGESIGWGWEPMVHPDDLEQVRTAWAEGGRTGQPLAVEARLRRGDGAYRWHLCRGVPLLDTDGTVVRWIGTAMDVEDLKRAEEERRASAQQWQFLAHASAALGSSLEVDQVLRTIARLSVPALADWCTVDMLEPDGSVRRVAVTHADPTKRDILDMAATYPPDPEGRHPRTGVLRTGRSVLIPEVPEEAPAQIASDEAHRAALHRLGYRSAMMVAIRARGRTLGALTFATSESGRRYGPEDLALAEDLAHRAALAVDNARLYAEAQEASRLKDEFLATVSHELRTPLASMMNWVALLRQGKIGPEQVARGLDVLQRAGETQARLIDDILDVSRIVSGRLRLQPQPVDLAEVVRDAVETVRPAADARRVRLEMAGDADGVRVVGDPGRLQQVVWNLVANGVKFTPEGGWVAVRLEQTAEDARIVVTDSGEGIAPEFLPFVFDRFRQAERVANRRHTGLGLGLAIVKHLVEAHGGQVEARSDGRGRGSTFSVSLPLAPPAA